MSRRDYFDKSAIQQMATSANHRSQMRRKARDSLRESTDPNERFAVVLADGGFGVVDVSTRANVPIEVASMLVRGE